MNELIIFILIEAAVIIIQQLFFMRQVQKLIDKLMSRNYFEYESAKPRAEKLEVKLPKDNELPDDLRVLQGIGLN